ncbi:MAG: HDOD domain-containing protein [Candidatus Desulfofervidaceae bacterium]|nr:HDOD domain-containing protein [Candidatus Desulfofervidaceae bacterium]
MSEKIESFLRKHIINKTKIPSLSPLVIRLIEVASDERNSAKELAQIIEKDPD